MKRSRKRQLYGALALSLSVALCMTAFWGKGVLQKQKTLTVGLFSESNWGMPDNRGDQVIEAAIEKFERMNPGVHVEFESGIMRKDYPEWLAEKFLRGEEPDVFMVTAEDFGMLASKGALLKLDERMDKDVAFERDGFYEASLASGRYEQVQYALPYESVVTLMCVNTSLLRNAGMELPGNDWTWEDLHAICYRATRDTNRDGILDRFGICNYDWRNAAYSNGAVLFNESGTESYVNEWSFISAVKFVYTLDGLTKGAQVTRKDFENGRVIFCPISVSEYKKYKTYPWKALKFADFEWQCMDMPSGPHGNIRSEVDSLLFGISAHTKQEELAWEFLKILTCDEEVQMKILTCSDGISVQKSVMESEQARNELNSENTADGIDAELLDRAMKQGALSPRFRKYESAFALLDDGVQEAMESEKDIGGSLASLQRKLNTYLKN